VLTEALSFIVRSSLLKILRDGLIEHFEDAAARLPTLRSG
jgi:hypothetical protein